MTRQHPPPVGAYGSSFLSTGPQTDGTSGSRVDLQKRIRLFVDTCQRMLRVHEGEGRRNKGA